MESGSFGFDTSSLSMLRSALAELEKGFESLPAVSSYPSDSQAMEGVILEVARRLRDNYPYFHPLYAGQMLKPPHAVARIAYALAMWVNPNNHALDAGRATSAMEKEAVAEIAGMFGWTRHLGHLCGGGTMANLEALWVSGQLHPGKKIVASQQAHYTHGRVSQVLGLDFETIACDRRGRLDIDALESVLRRGDIGTVVATIGTTAVGSVDWLPGVLALKERYGFRLHADAAYGGYFGLADNLADETGQSYARLGEADSIVIDPHKHGLQPYGCGCVLFKDPGVGRFYKHDSPYTYFSSDELHLGEISLECSRAGAAAAGLWATQKLYPLVKGGEFSRMLSRCRTAALGLHKKLSRSESFFPVMTPELDIVIALPRAANVSKASALSRKIFQTAARRDLHLALADLPVSFLDENDITLDRDLATVKCIRSVLMKPEHLDWVDTIMELLEESAGES